MKAKNESFPRFEEEEFRNNLGGGEDRESIWGRTSHCELRLNSLFDGP